MATLTIAAPATLPAGEIVATGVSAEEYMARYAEDRHEWVKGVVIKMSPASLQRVLLTQYLWQLLGTYFAFNAMGRVVGQPFVMRLGESGSYREPDLQVVLNSNAGELTDTAMIGPADICVEVVSPESASRDYGDKFIEYEQAGVREYWVVDPHRQVCHFHRLQAAGLYVPLHADEAGDYVTPLLPRLVLHVPTLWQTTLPEIPAIVQAVQKMMENAL